MVGEAVLMAYVFDRVSLLHCRRWEARSLQAVRALLVEGKRMTDVAEQFGMKPQQVVVLRVRFLEKIQREAARKLPAEKFMGIVPPANLSRLSPFASDIRQLLHRGYSEEQIAEFLRANEVTLAPNELSEFLGAMNENSGSGESKRRRR